MGFDGLGVGQLILPSRSGRTEKALPSTSVLGNALRSTNEVVDKGANQLRENDDHDPNNLVVSLTRLFRRAFYDHRNPEHQGGDSKKEKEQHETGSKHSHPPNPNGYDLDRRIRKLQTPLYTACFRTLPCPDLPLVRPVRRKRHHVPHSFDRLGFLCRQFDHIPSITLKLQGLPLVEIPAC
jgi:hypothetical protein